MTDRDYEQLAEALDRLPNGFPRTPSNAEIRLLKKIFSPEEASLASRLSIDMEAVEAISKRVDEPVDEIGLRLRKMAERGLVWSDSRGKTVRYRLAPFIVGSYEAQVNNMDHELAHLVEHYLADGGAAGIMKPDPAIHRVVPAQSALKTEWILPYDDVRRVLLASKTFNVYDCICRLQQAQLGRRCNFPVRMCLTFSSVERAPGPNGISKDEAVLILNKAEEIGLVHTVSNVARGVGYVCNCCGCCCGILRGITEWGIEKSVACANYYAVIDPDECVQCGTCRERCQVHAISEEDGLPVVDREHCIGCGLCVTGCPNDAARLERKPEDEIVHPPQDFATWEHERLLNRGLSE